MRTSSVTFLLGGARSGKTSYAEEMARRFDRVLYYGTARGMTAGDALSQRIDRLKEARPAAWVIKDAPLDFQELGEIVKSEKIQVLVFDCVTLWLGWELTENHKKYSRQQLLFHVQKQTEYLLQMCKSLPCHVLIISSEVGAGVPPSHSSGRIFRDTLSELNLEIAKAADLVCQMSIGQALLIKDVFAKHGIFQVHAVSAEWLARKVQGLPFFARAS